MVIVKFGVPYCIQIAQTYAFLPREAVTKFLMSCSDCQKRMHLTMDSAYSSPPVDSKPSGGQLAGVTRSAPHHPLQPSPRSVGVTSDGHQLFDNTPQITDYTLPITVSYLNYLKQKKVGRPSFNLATLLLIGDITLCKYNCTVK